MGDFAYKFVIFETILMHRSRWVGILGGGWNLECSGLGVVLDVAVIISISPVAVTCAVRRCRPR